MGVVRHKDFRPADISIPRFPSKLSFSSKLRLQSSVVFFILDQQWDPLSVIRKQKTSSHKDSTEMRGQGIRKELRFPKRKADISPSYMLLIATQGLQSQLQFMTFIILVFG